jgi:hypothetical protein
VDDGVALKRPYRRLDLPANCRFANLRKPVADVVDASLPHIQLAQLRGDLTGTVERFSLAGKMANDDDFLCTPSVSACDHLAPCVGAAQIGVL